MLDQVLVQQVRTGEATAVVSLEAEQVSAAARSDNSMSPEQAAAVVEQAAQETEAALADLSDEVQGENTENLPYAGVQVTIVSSEKPIAGTRQC